MKKNLLRFLVLLIPVLLFSWTVFADQPWILWISSEWEATGFNNGVRIVRDSNGYFHAFWHSQEDTSAIPSGSGCDIFYSYTTAPANEPPSMAWQGAWAPSVNLTALLHNQDNRYPAVAIEYDYYTGPWRGVNTLQIVWQAILPNGRRYEVLYAKLPISNPPTPPAPWTTAKNLSETPGTDSLVPAIAINKYRDVNYKHSLHVVWQEDDIYPAPATIEDTPFSDIAYIYSPNSGTNWAGPAGGWSGHIWDNITRSNANSQMPSIACIPDQYTGSPGGRPGDLGFNSDDVHVSFNEDTGTGINVYYLRSPNNGVNWNPRINVSLQMGGTDFDAYTCIAVDQLDNPHIVFMRHKMSPSEPLRTATDFYIPGKNPTYPQAFPGPKIGMYGALVNRLVYAYFDGIMWTGNFWDDEHRDREFPTVSLDRWQHVNVNWQEYNLSTNDYNVVRATNINRIIPGYPVQRQVYQGFSTPITDSQEGHCDELFPNLAFKKAAMYKNYDERNLAGYDEIWTMTNGNGPAAAISSPKTIMQDGNVKYDYSL